MAEEEVDVGDAITEEALETCSSLDQKIHALSQALARVQDPNQRGQIQALIIQLRRRKRALGCP